MTIVREWETGPTATIQAAGADSGKAGRQSRFLPALPGSTVHLPGDHMLAEWLFAIFALAPIRVEGDDLR